MLDKKIIFTVKIRARGERFVVFIPDKTNTRMEALVE